MTTSNYTNYSINNINNTNDTKANYTKLTAEDHKKLRTNISKLVISQTLFAPIFITAISLTTRKEKDYVSIKVRNGNKDFKLGRLYRFIFFPTKHMEYYKQCAKTLKMKINDYLDKVISGEFDLCDNSDSKYMLTDVQLLEQYPFLEITRNGLCYTYKELDELRKIETNDIKNGTTPNNILPKYFDKATKLAYLLPIAQSTYEHIGCEREEFSTDLFNLDELVIIDKDSYPVSNSKLDSTSNSASDSASVSNLSSDSSNTNELMKEILELDNSCSAEIIENKPNVGLEDILDIVEDCDLCGNLPRDEDKFFLELGINSDKSSKQSKSYSFKVDINSVISGKRGPKTSNTPRNSIVAKSISCSKSYLTACLMREVFDKEHLIEDIATALSKININGDNATKIIDLIVAISTINISSKGFSYSSLNLAQKAQALGISTVLNPSSVPILLRLLANKDFLEAFNHCRISRIKSSDNLIIDSTKIKHESKNNVKAAKTVHSVDKHFINAISTTIGVSELRNMPVYLEINCGNRSDFNIIKNVINIFDIYDMKDVSQIVVDRGYVSLSNLYESYQSGVYMIGALKSNNPISQKLINDNHVDIFKHGIKYVLDSDDDINGKTVPITLNIDDDKQLDCYAHIFYNQNTRASKLAQLSRLVKDVIITIKSIKSCNALKDKYNTDSKFKSVIKKYFNNYSSLEDIFNNRKDITPDYDAISSDTDKLGYFVTISTSKLSASDAYRFYKNRASIEVYNKHLKNACSLKTQRSHTTETSIGSQILTFITSIASYSLQNHMTGNSRDYEGNLISKLPTKIVKKYKTRFHLFAQLDDHKIFIDFNKNKISNVNIDKHLEDYLKAIGFPNFRKTAEKYVERIKENEAIVTVKLKNQQ